METTWERELHWIDLADWRRQVARSYRERDVALDAGDEPRAVWNRWRSTKDKLFRSHPQSPLSDTARLSFNGLPCFPYDPEWRIEARLEPILDEPLVLGETTPLGTRIRKAARLVFGPGGPSPLIAYWIDVYGGSLFLPFRDSSCDADAYEGGRYLIDTAKGSDFYYPAGAKDRVVVDFNYAYNPSCAYDERWSCPLAQRENYVDRAIRAGELRFRAL